MIVSGEQPSAIFGSFQVTNRITKTGIAVTGVSLYLILVESKSTVLRPNRVATLRGSCHLVESRISCVGLHLSKSSFGHSRVQLENVSIIHTDERIVLTKLCKLPLRHHIFQSFLRWSLNSFGLYVFLDDPELIDIQRVHVVVFGNYHCLAVSVVHNDVVRDDNFLVRTIKFNGFNSLQLALLVPSDGCLPQ